MGWLRNGLKWLAPGGPVTGAVPAARAPLPAPPAPAAAAPPGRPAAADSPPLDPDAEPTEAERAAWRQRIEAEEMAFFAGLKARTGRTYIEWCDWLDAAAMADRRDRMLELLQREGFTFRWASVLERTWVGRSRRDTQPPEPGGLPSAPEAEAEAVLMEPAAVPLAAGAPVPAGADSPAAGTACADDAADGGPALRRCYPHTPREHAAALIGHVARLHARARLPADIFWKELQRLHGAMCAGLGWPERPWNPIAAELSQLIGEPKPHYPRLSGTPRGRRWRYYELHRILAAAASGPPVQPAAVPLALPAPPVEAEPMRAAA
jgi:hypothetical protein